MSREEKVAEIERLLTEKAKNSRQELEEHFVNSFIDTSFIDTGEEEEELDQIIAEINSGMWDIDYQTRR